jgi:hypothetical protein
MDSVDLLIAQARKEVKDIEAREKGCRRDRTILKYQNSQKRIEELDRKISKLQKERENLVRKQESRLNFLRELEEK